MDSISLKAVRPAIGAELSSLSAAAAAAAALRLNISNGWSVKKPSKHPKESSRFTVVRRGFVWLVKQE